MKRSTREIDGRGTARHDEARRANLSASDLYRRWIPLPGYSADDYADDRIGFAVNLP